MKCLAKVISNLSRRRRGKDPCPYSAKYLVVAPGAPKVVCGHHARAYVKSCLIPIKLLDPNVNLDQLPDINGFLDSVKQLGIDVSIASPVISINFRSV